MSNKLRVEVTVYVFPWDTGLSEGGPERITIVLDEEDADTQEKLIAEAAKQAFLTAKGATRRKRPSWLS